MEVEEQEAVTAKPQVPAPIENDTVVAVQETSSSSSSSASVAAPSLPEAEEAVVPVDDEAEIKKAEETMDQYKTRQRALAEGIASLEREILSQHKQLCAEVAKQLSLDPLVSLCRLVELHSVDSKQLDVLQAAVSEAETVLKDVEETAASASASAVPD